MDLSLPIAAGLIYAAYSLTQKQDRTEKIKREHVSKNEKFNGKNIYESKRFDEVKEEIQRKADLVFQESKDYKKSNKIPPFLNSLCYDNCDKKEIVKTKTSILPLSKKISSKLIDTPLKEEQKGYKSDTQKNPNKPISLLTGEPIELQHNNMVPFFKGETKQNLTPGATLIEKFTGKLETPTLKIGRAHV